MKHLIRIFSAALALALVFSAVPSAHAFTLEGKQAASSQECILNQDVPEFGGHAPTLNAGESDYLEASPDNNSPETADVAELNSIWTGVTSASNKQDFFKITLTKQEDILFTSFSTAPTMIFGLFDPDGIRLATCEFMGILEEEDLYVDALIGTLEAGTYYVMVAQADFEGNAAYAQDVAYALEFHVHSYTAVVTQEPTCTAAGIRHYTCDCGVSYDESIPTLPHTYTAGTPVAPTCTNEGYTPYTCTCGATEERDFVAALGHDLSTEATPDPENERHSFSCSRCETTVYENCSFEYDSGTKKYVCSVCGSTASTTVYRIAGATRVQTSMTIADALKQQLAISKFDSVIVASSRDFPDALTGSYLAAVTGAPILLTHEAVHADTVSYITQNMDWEGTVYILGGENSVSADFEYRLAELEIPFKRLAGSGRLQTNLAILEEAGVTPGQDVLVCTANSFADSLSASASGLPILLVQNTLSKQQKEFLSKVTGKLIIIGGEASVSSAMEEALNAYGTVERVAGSNRYETSTKVAERFYPDPDQVVLAYARNYPDGLCGGPLSYAMGAPLILTDGNCSWANNYMTWRDIQGGFVLGGSSLVEDSVVRTLFGMPENAPIPGL